MKNYKVTGHIAIIGVGIVLKLSSSQAETRASSLKQKKKGIYIVLEPVQFKQNEEITIISGNVSKSVLKNLTDLSESAKKSDPKNNKAAKKNQKDKANDNKGVDDIPKNQEAQDQIIPDGNDVNNLPNV
ncbi:hypothetical protein N9O56_02205 [Rickettsiales bacterium]|nr:hypothetical protein [Rickettsiales bacterium]